MAVKKKASVSKKTESVESAVSLEESVIKEERRPPVTQVVEVVEEEASPTQSHQKEQGETVDSTVRNDEQNASSKVSEENVGSDSAFASTSDDEETGKRKELVDELFQKHDSSEPDVMPEISIHTKRPAVPMVLWTVVVVIICVLIGGALMVFTGKVKSFPSIKLMSSPTPTTTATPKPTPTPTPANLKRSDIKIQVINGGGKAGAATKMKKFLEDKGYSMSGTANADSYTFDKTQISTKASKQAYTTMLEQDLKDTYTLATSDSSLAESAAYDVSVTVGKE